MWTFVASWLEFRGFYESTSLPAKADTLLGENRMIIKGKSGLVAFAFIASAILLSGSAIAQSFDYSVIHSFGFGASSDGSAPFSPLFQDNKGRLYGTTFAGGTGYGAIYQISATGKEKVIYSFSGGSDGSQPFAGLIGDSAGNLYGVTSRGGDLSCNAYGCGTVFKLDSSHQLSVLHIFTVDDGWDASSALVRDGLGNLYGTLTFGGTSTKGKVFKLDPSGSLTVLYDFTDDQQFGRYPANLLIDKMGNLYGTTQYGGTYNAGTLFKIDPNGHISVIYAFAGGSDGNVPLGALARDAVGNVYGATQDGGVYGYGTVFRVNVLSGAETVLHSFTATEGSDPMAGVVIDSAGNLFGTTFYGGGLGFGSIFMLDANGVYTKLHDFAKPPDGNSPWGLIIDRAGNLLGTTETGGRSRGGTVYKLTRQ